MLSSRFELDFFLHVNHFGGGGGNSGEIKFPDHMETFHKEMLDDTGADTLDYSITDLANTAWGVGGNPYNGESSYDPTTELAANQTELSAHNSLLAGLDEETDWDSMVDNAVAKVADTIFTEAQIDSAVSAFTDSVNNRYLREVNRLTGFYYEVGAVVSSSFPLALALSRSEVEAEINRFEQSLRIDHMQKKFEFIQQGVANMSRLLAHRIDAEARLLSLTTDINSIQIDAKYRQTLKDIELDAMDALWDFQVMGEVAKTLAAVSGTPSYYQPPQLSAAEKGLQGALSGGGVIGSLISAFAPSNGG